ncbi:MAG: Eco57I restriction-modification methylase domain-containing protein [Rhodospirillaceae bacterium]|nr:Eco57I restriction-modification methylase domain-containing protein [Rhodospirillaceae bacterium]
MKTETVALDVRQPSLPSLCPITSAVERLSSAGAEVRGAVFTRREVVDFILDLSGYSSDRPLHRLRHLEPSFGGGDFLLPAIERLLEAWKSDDRHARAAFDLSDSIRAIELHRHTFEGTRAKVITLLTDNGLNLAKATALADRWLTHGDFLLTSIDGKFDVVVGNPPYVRQELIPDALIAEYRSRYRTIYDRADLYIPFIERSLSLLKDGGRLGFICADRWMKNRYGGPLRQFVAADYRLRVYVDMFGTSAFHSEVIAYPAITIIGREKPGPTRVARRPDIDGGSLAKLANALSAPKPETGGSVRELAGVCSGADPWILEANTQSDLVRRLESAFPKIEDAGCKVGIGVATGNDKAFIAPLDMLDVEPDRKLPLVTTRDIVDGTVNWRGLGVINPFKDDGGLVNLQSYPRLARYLNARKEEIASRHCAQKVPANWYRTIDRIYPALLREPKLLIPDIKGHAHIVFEQGRYYPHHNLYFVTSREWDLKALQAVLLSGIARLFISAYSTRMRGGYLRFQAQYLRRIRIPKWSNVPAKLKRELVWAVERKDLAACNQASYRLYGLSDDDMASLGADGEAHGN